MVQDRILDMHSTAKVLPVFNKWYTYLDHQFILFKFLKKLEYILNFCVD